MAELCSTITLLLQTDEDNVRNCAYQYMHEKLVWIRAILWMILAVQVGWNMWRIRYPVPEESGGISDAKSTEMERPNYDRLFRFV
jgi:hypothetical protein